MPRRTTTTVDSPIGPLVLRADDGVLSGVFMDTDRHAPPAMAFGTAGPAAFGAVIEQLDAYFAGDLREFTVPVCLDGTAFQRQVWSALQEIPYGATESYGALAARVGTPGAARAVGLANGRNPIAIIVPCHRVIGSTGSLTGYGGGLERKQWLLAHERGGTLFDVIGR